jgi:hypothetical protein
LLISVEEVKTAMKNGDFKPICANVMIEFLLRHGLIEEEMGGVKSEELVESLHRELPFPTAPA